MKHRVPIETLNVAANLSAAAKHDPLLFLEYAWPWGQKGTPFEHQDLRTWQAQVAHALAKHFVNPDTRYDVARVAVSSGHGIGKSALMGMISTWALCCHMDPRIVVTANTEGQLRTKTSPEIGSWVKSSLFGHLFTVDTMRIALKEAPDQHRLDFTPWSETNPEAFQGLHARGRLVLVQMDEGSAIPPVIWETIEGALTDEETLLVQMVFGNPTQPAGRFRDCFTKHRSSWYTWQIDSRTVEGTNKKVLQDIVDRYGEDSDVAKVRVRGLFPSLSTRQYIPEHIIDAAMDRHLRAEQYNFAPVILTCDPAWTGDDELVIGKRQGLKFEILDVIPKNTNDVEVGRMLAGLEVRHDADAVFIDMGWGTGIYSYGQTIGRQWTLINFGAKAHKEGFVNKRAEMYDDTRKWLEDGGALPRDPKLREDLMSVQTKPRGDGKIDLMSKEDMRKQGLASPDRADALVLSFAEPVMRRAVPISTLEGTYRKTGLETALYPERGKPYNPWDD